MTDNRAEKQKTAQRLTVVMAGKVYKHFKGGLYVVDHVDVDSETAELRVSYHSFLKSEHWSRPFDMFTSDVDRSKYPDATQEKRFERMPSGEAARLYAEMGGKNDKV